MDIQVVRVLPVVNSAAVNTRGMCTSRSRVSLDTGPGVGVRGRMVTLWVSLVALVVKNPPANAGDARDARLIPGSGRSPGVGNGSPLQYSGLEISMD